MSKQDDLWNKALHGGLRIRMNSSVINQDGAGLEWVSEPYRPVWPFQIIEQIEFVSGNKRMSVQANLVSEKIAPTFEIIEGEEEQMNKSISDLMIEAAKAVELEGKKRFADGRLDEAGRSFAIQSALQILNLKDLIASKLGG